VAARGEFYEVRCRCQTFASDYRLM